MGWDDTAYLFITTEGVSRSGFDAQVLEPLRDLADCGLVFDLLVFGGLRRGLVHYRAEKNREPYLRRALSPGRVWLCTVPKLASPFGMAAAAMLAVARLTPAILGNRDCVCHCRGHQAGLIGARIKRMLPRCRIVLDIRGDVVAETAAEGSPVREGLLREVGLAVESASHIICVSEVLRQHIVGQYPCATTKTTVIPCTASSRLFYFDRVKRREARDQLGLAGRVALVYCGAMTKAWQIPDQLITAFRRLHEVHPMLHLLLLTPDTGVARQLVSELGIDGRSVTIERVEHADVPGYLMAADVGLMLRHRDSVNAVASPTKLAEYLMTGLPVVVTDGIGDTSDIVCSGEFGSIIEDVDDFVAVNAAVWAAIRLPSSDDDRSARASRASALLSSEAFLSKRLEVYKACRGDSA